MSKEKKINVFGNLWRLLKYTRRYWLRLTIGVISGMLVGGSLFVTLMMIPQVVGVVKDAEPPQQLTVQADEQPRENIPESALKDPQLKKILDQASSAAEMFHLPFSVDGTTIHVSWPEKFSFEAVNSNG